MLVIEQNYFFTSLMPWGNDPEHILHNCQGAGSLMHFLETLRVAITLQQNGMKTFMPYFI